MPVPVVPFADTEPATRRRRTTTTAVVVGVEGTDVDRGAVRWAAREAACRAVPLALLHVVDDDLVRVAEDISGLGRVVDEVFDRAQASVVDLSPSAQRLVATGPPAVELAWSVKRGDLLVLGRREPGKHKAAGLAAVTATVVCRAPGPTAVVPSGWDPDLEAGRPVLVAVAGDHETTSADALRYGFEIAHRDGAELRVVHVEGRAPDEPEQEARPLLDAVGKLSAAYPDVDVVLEPRRGACPEALVAESRTARVLVLGGRRFHPIGAVPGPVARVVLREAACPVVVVHQDGAPQAPRRSTSSPG